MYWRIKTHSPEYYLRMYAIHIALVVSLVLNALLIVTRPSNKNLNKEQKGVYEQFSKDVIGHMLDRSYVSYEHSMLSLKDELAPSIVAKLQKEESLPKSMDELKILAETQRKNRELSAVNFNKIKVGELTPVTIGQMQVPLVPVEVDGTFAVHSLDESQNIEQTPFKFRLFIGTNSKTQKPILVIYEDHSPPPNA